MSLVMKTRPPPQNMAKSKRRRPTGIVRAYKPCSEHKGVWAFSFGGVSNGGKANL
jgi:hypothetical protein